MCKIIITIFFSTVILLTLTIPLGCTASQPANTADSINIVVTIQPQLEFAGKVGGDKITVAAMVPPGAEPHTYEPLPSQITNLAKADIYAQVGSGVEFELAWLDKLKATNNSMLIVDCADGIELIYTGEENDEGHEQEQDSHHHGALDPHIWTSPLNALIMTENIFEGLKTIDHENRSYYESNFQSYKQQLLGLDADIREALNSVNNRVFMTYHPAYAYFAREYGLEMIAIQNEGKEPSAADITNLIKTAKDNNIKIIIVSPQFNPQSAEIIAGEIGGRTIPVDVLSPDYFDNMQYFVNELLDSLQ